MNQQAEQGERWRRKSLSTSRGGSPILLKVPAAVDVLIPFNPSDKLGRCYYFHVNRRNRSPEKLSDAHRHTTQAKTTSGFADRGTNCTETLRHRPRRATGKAQAQGTRRKWTSSNPVGTSHLGSCPGCRALPSSRDVTWRTRNTEIQRQKRSDRFLRPPIQLQHSWNPHSNQLDKSLRSVRTVGGAGPGFPQMWGLMGMSGTCPLGQRLALGPLGKKGM